MTAFFRGVSRSLCAALAVAAASAGALAQTSGYIKSIGAGCAGASNSTPALAATGSVGAGRAVQFTVTGPPNMAGTIVLGDTLSPSAISPGCTLEVLVDPVWGPFYLFFGLDGTGTANVGLGFPPTMPSVVGQKLYAQAVIDDQASPAQLIVSNGLSLTGNVRVFVSNGQGFGNWSAASTWVQIDGGITGLGIPGFDEHYDVVIIRAGDTVRQTSQLPKTLGLYELEEGATHQFENNADLAAFVVEAFGKLDIRGAGKPAPGVYASPQLTVRNAAEVMTVGDVDVVRSNDPNFCALVAAAPEPFDTLSCTDDTPAGPPPRPKSPAGEDFEEGSTHPAMAGIAMDNDTCVLTWPEDYLLHELRMTKGIHQVLRDPSDTQKPNRSAREWVVHGVQEEDDLFPTIRVLRHFFDPYTNTGLFGTYAPSDVWGSTHGSNSWNFVNARQHYYDGLTKPAKATRDEEMARTFRNIGQVMHLIQDLAAAPHVRNDAHPVHRAIEDYAQFNFGNETIILNRLPQVTLSGLANPKYNFSLRLGTWWPQGWGHIPEFTVLRHFWDTEQLTFNNFNGFALNRPPGLAEVVNFNFWSLDTVFDPDHPRPSVADTNLVALFPAPANGRRFFRTTDYIPTPLPQNGWVAVSKTAGPGRIPMNTLAAAKNFGPNAVRSWFSWVVGTGKDRVGVGIYNHSPGPLPNTASVLFDYGTKLVPMAIGYSTGFVNYFFRGKLGIRLQWDHQQQIYKVIIKNESNEALGPGTWELYQDDINGDNRAPVPGRNLPYPGSLAPNATFTATFPPHLTKRGRFTLVFRGTLGNEVGTAVIGKVFDALRVEAEWAPWADGDLYLWDFDSQLIYDANKLGNYGEHDVDVQNGHGPENITMHALIPGRLQFMVNYGEDHTKEQLQIGGQCVTQTPPLHQWDQPGTPCYKQTDLVLTVRTYHNRKTPIHTKYRTLSVPDRSTVPQANKPVGPVGQSWHVTQLVTIDEFGAITFDQ